MVKIKRILVLGTNAQIQILRDRISQVVDKSYLKGAKVEYCARTALIPEALSGPINSPVLIADPENPDKKIVDPNTANWNLPIVVLYTGQMRGETPSGMDITVDTDGIEARIRNAGVKDVQKIDPKQYNFCKG